MRYKVTIEIDFDGDLFIDDQAGYQDMCDEFWHDISEMAKEGDAEVLQRTHHNEATGDARWEKVQ